MSSRRSLRLTGAMLFLVALAAMAPAKQAGRAKPAPAPTYVLNDSHLHLTNYIQEGTDIQTVVRIMGKKVGRAALFGIPLQQQWSHRVSGDRAPTYYLDTDASLYYYSFTDAHIAMQYLSLGAEDRARFDPMITGFNPTDMYAADHIRRVLLTFPGVFSGIGEFTVHKEFVSSKIDGDVASLQDPALDRILDFAGEVGLVVILHNDLDVPYSDEPDRPAYLEQLLALFKRHKNTTIIWAHLGVGRIIQPVKDHAALIERICGDPDLKHVHFDLSWNELAKYVVASPASAQVTADLLARHPDRFLFGTDEVAPKDQQGYLRVHGQYAPLLALLDDETRAKVLRRNYERLFDRARRDVRAWERKQREGRAR